MAQLPQPGGSQRDQSKLVVFENFEKTNTQSLRESLSEKELAWSENLQPIAPNNWATVPAPAAAALASIGGTVSLLFAATISGTDYFIAFTAGGSAYGINIATGNVNHFALDGTFSSQPDLTTWQSSRILINDSVAGYSTWDGTLFIRQGMVSPNIVVTNGGGPYGFTPTVTISGGSGHGATAHAVMQNGSVLAVVLDNPGIGYAATDVLTVSFSTLIGSGATAHANMSGFNVGAIGVANSGAFTNPNALFVSSAALTFSGGGGSGAAGTATLSRGTDSGGGSYTFVSGVTLTNGGSGYTSVPSCTLTVSGAPNFPPPNFTQPVFTVALGSETVASITLDTGGSGYLSPPPVAISGGGGSGATAHTTLSGTSVNAVVLDSGGSGYFYVPTVAIGSTNNTAVAFARVWPFLPAGTTIAVFQGRIWLAGNQLLQWSGTGASLGNIAYDDFLAQDASGSLLLSDADLVHKITALRALNNYLFIMGDNSVKQIGNISLNASGTVTLFTILTLSSDQGTIYPKSCISYNRVFLFCNPNGVYGVFGSSVQKLSGDMDGIFKLVDFSQVPQGAVMDVNAIHNAVFLVRYSDPELETRSLLLAFDGKKWFPLNQGNNMVAIAGTESLSVDQNQLYGSSGSDVTQLLAANTIPIAFKMQSSLTHHGNAVQRKRMIRAGCAVSLASGTGTVTMTMDTENGSETYDLSLTAGFTVPYASVDGAGRYLGETLTGTLAGFTITNLIIEYQESALWG